MKYYKIIQNNNFIGVVNSSDFIRYHKYDHVFIGADETNGEFIECQGKLYRDSWMIPTPNEIQKAFEEAIIIEIDKETYLSFREVIANNEPIIMEELQPMAIEITNKIEEASVDFMRENKIKEMSNICHTTIEAGFNIILTDNEMHHFSLDTQDQLNLITLSALADTQEQIPYHADGEICKFYSAAEMKQIVAAATQFKMYHTTYYNALKAYINNLSTVKEIAAVTYGMELPEEYQSDVLKAIS